MKPKPNPAIAIPNIMKSNDIRYLREFRERILGANSPEVIAAIDNRLRELGESGLRSAIGKPRDDLSLAERVHESVRVYEQFLAHKHLGRRVAASRTRTMIKRWGEEEAVRRTVRNMTKSHGLDLLAKYGRMDCAYEQIILDFPDAFGSALVAKARENMNRLIAPSAGPTQVGDSCSA
jgi:hypothetical protein